MIVQADTAEMVRHAPPSSCRFLHVDASHQYRNTRTDVATARTLLRDDGIAVFDDFRSIHTPGVAAAVWEAVAELLRWLDGHPRYTAELHDVAGRRLVRVVDPEAFNPALLPA